VSLVSITSGGKPDSKASCLIGGLVGEGPTTQPYLWLDLNERCDQMQKTQPYAGDRGQISARGREVLAKLIRPFGRLDWTGLTVLAATNVRAVPKEASKYGAVGGTKLFLVGRISAGGKREVRVHPTSASGPNWLHLSGGRSSWPLSNKTAVEFWAVGAHFRRWPWALWRSPMMLKRDDTIAQQETHSGNFWLPCCSQRGSRALVTSPTVPTMATMMIIVHPPHSWPRFMGG
jgi:hypothetical protein